MTSISIRQSIQIIILAIVFIFALKYFQHTPLEEPFFRVQAGFLVLILLFLTGYIATTLVEKDRINKIMLYYIFLIVLVPFYGAYRAGVVFGQPFIYGFLSEREWLLCGVGIWLYHALVARKYTLQTMESAFVFMAWASLILFSVLILTYDPGQMQDAYKESGMLQITKYRGLRFRFETYFITFGAIYYFVKYSIKNNPFDLTVLLLFLGYILFVVQGRTYVMAIAATYLVYYWLNHSSSKLTLTMIKYSLFLIVAFMAIQALMPDYISQMGHLFLQMLKIITGEVSDDASANARIIASRIVFDYFDAHPLSLWLGTGSVSHQWNDGYRSIFGYFYPSDIGVLGGLFVYGLVGFVFLFLVPLIILIKTLKKITEKKDVFIVSLKYLLIFALVRSIQGSLYFEYVAYTIPLFILLASLKMQGNTNAY